MRLRIVLTALLFSACGPAWEVTWVSMAMVPPPVVLPATSPGGEPVPVGDLSHAEGHIELDVFQKRLVFTARGLPQIPGNRLQQGFRYRLWLRDAGQTPYYIDALSTDFAGRAELIREFEADGPPLGSIREAMVVLWYDESPRAIEPSFSSTSGALTGDGEIGQRKDFHSGSGAAHTGWVLEGVAEDLPAESSEAGGDTR